MLFIETNPPSKLLLLYEDNIVMPAAELYDSVKHWYELISVYNKLTMLKNSDRAVLLKMFTVQLRAMWPVPSHR